MIQLLQYNGESFAQPFYLCGPMSNVEGRNSVIFNHASRLLSKLGLYHYNPQVITENTPWIEAMKLDLPRLLESKTVVVLPLWQASKGALLEYYIANYVGIKILFWSDNLCQYLTSICNN